jgi:hypothetical protein
LLFSASEEMVHAEVGEKKNWGSYSLGDEACNFTIFI